MPHLTSRKQRKVRFSRMNPNNISAPVAFFTLFLFNRSLDFNLINFMIKN
uniref:Uncharacterized protein n=1 Tax=Candidatus Kentrum sp. TC TaxID=2126339 RepID=A0A450YS23_9GAMM|nr:MAG: hypothetical protein BECKTC1821E_GA0114239_103331 [Candidatus Kentron sp. TC]